MARLTGHHDYFEGKKNKTLRAPFMVDTALQKQPDYDSMNRTAAHGTSYLDSIINTDNIYTQYFQNMPEIQKNALNKYQGNEYVDINETLTGKNPTDVGRRLIPELDAAFVSCPLLPKFLVTYRCYKSVVTLEKLQENPRVKTFISVSLSKRLVDGWCATGDTRFKICVLLLPGTPGVVPIVYKKFVNYQENELLLDRDSYLFHTGLRHSGVPVFLYLHKSIPRNNIDRFIERARTQLEENIQEQKTRQNHYWDWQATEEDMKHPPNVLGGRKTRRKRKKHR